MTNDLNETVERLYHAFSSYHIDDLKKIGCFDMGPTQEEIEGLSKGLRNIPDRVVSLMEFFGSGWDSWGSKNDVGYLLPRIMQYIAEDISRLDNRGLFSLFYFKLEGLFSDTNVDWNSYEKNEIKHFIEALFKENLSTESDIGLLIESALIMHFDNNLIISNMAFPSELSQEQIISILVHFGRYKPDDSNLFGSCYSNADRIEGFLDVLFSQLSENQISEIYNTIASRYIV